MLSLPVWQPREKSHSGRDSQQILLTHDKAEQSLVRDYAGHTVCPIYCVANTGWISQTKSVCLVYYN